MFYLAFQNLKIMAVKKSKTKSRKKDRKLVAGTEEYEVQHLAEKYNIEPRTVRAVRKKVGASRRAVEAELKLRGYVVGGTKKKTKKKPVVRKKMPMD